MNGPARCSAYGRDREPLTERHVQALWYDRDIRPEGLVTRCGEAVRVVHPGEWNLGAGPDFLGAVLEVGPARTRLSGDVEIHLRPRDWEAHGHGTDPAYRNVIAHVTWGCGPEPPSLPAGAVSIWIGRFATAKVGFSPDQIDLGAYPFARLPADERPCRARLGSDPDFADGVLKAAGACRLRMKARRYERLLGQRDREELFYAEVMQALGYKKNQRGFAEVAARVPLARVRAEPANAAEAFLAAGAFAEWNRGACRPRNRPEVRLRAAAALFTETDALGLVDARDFSRPGTRGMVAALSDDGFVGRGRAAAIVANVVVPFALAEGRLGGVPEDLPPEDLSEPARLTAFRLFGRDHNPAVFYARNGLKIQGLIQVHRDYCLQMHPDCGPCTFPEAVSP